MEDGDFFCQDDPRWKDLLWYDKTARKSLAKVTKAFHRYVEQPDAAELLIKEADRFCETIKNIARKPYVQSSKKEGSLSQSGCWHLSAVNLLNYLGQKNQNGDWSPPALLKILRDKMLGTLTGYVGPAFADPITTITNSEIQLIKHYDFGKNGISSKNVSTSGHLSKIGRKYKTAAIVNVESHEFLEDDNDKDCHYVLAIEEYGGDIKIQDSGDQTKALLFKSYPKIFQISIYMKSR